MSGYIKLLLIICLTAFSADAQDIFKSARLDDFGVLAAPGKTAISNKAYKVEMSRLRAELKMAMRDGSPDDSLELPNYRPLGDLGAISIAFFSSQKGDDIKPFRSTIMALRRAAVQKNGALVTMGAAYVKERLDFDDPCWGFMVLFHPKKAEAKPQLVGFILATEFAVWNWKRFSWEQEQLVDESVCAVSRSGVDFEPDGSSRYVFDDLTDCVDRLGKSKVMLGGQETALHGSAEDLVDHIEYPTLAEISLTFGLSTGGLMIDLLEYYHKRMQTHRFIVLDATLDSEPFYQHMKFAPIFPKQGKRPYMHWLNPGEAARKKERAHMYFKAVPYIEQP